MEFLFFLGVLGCYYYYYYCYYDFRGFFWVLLARFGLSEWYIIFMVIFKRFVLGVLCLFFASGGYHLCLWLDRKAVFREYYFPLWFSKVFFCQAISLSAKVMGVFSRAPISYETAGNETQLSCLGLFHQELRRFYGREVSSSPALG